MRGDNLEPVSYTHLDVYKRQSLPTLPVSNIVLIGATGKQNKTIKRQVSLEVMSNGETLPMIFLIAHNLPFEILIGCDILRKYSAIIDMRLSKVTMRYEDKEWMAELTGSKGVIPISTIYNIRTICDSPDRRWEVKPDNQINSDILWNQKLEEIRQFRGTQDGNPLRIPLTPSCMENHHLEL